MRKPLLVAAALCVLAVSAWAADTTVTQSHTSFDVDSATVKAGDSITFTNKDDVTHNIQVVDADENLEDKGLQKPGQDIKETFAKPGTYKVRCAIHPKMKMTVTVQ
jgi:plastocyanin